MLPRTPEPEVMDGSEQSAAYANADFEAVNSAFVSDLLMTFPHLQGQRCVDLGCGPADIVARLALARPGLHVTGVDASAEMLGHAEVTVAQHALQKRVTLIQGYLPGALQGARRFELVLSNSLLHHLNDPMTLWTTLREVAAPGAGVYIMDLRRPESDARAQAIVQEHAAEEPEVLRHDFYKSLHAAYTPDEVGAQLALAGLNSLSVSLPSDRHILVSGYVD